ncbi:MAG: hypothetical protein A2Y76_10995 [Planctomycetes bacterium RBG_13_60_9]|nr:MAG: hypothetical protein A2Y76_10995 [Planctomycetes bacterium RBG_13_60_9]
MLVVPDFSATQNKANSQEPDASLHPAAFSPWGMRPCSSALATQRSQEGVVVRERTTYEEGAGGKSGTWLFLWHGSG